MKHIQRKITREPGIGEIVLIPIYQTNAIHHVNVERTYNFLI